MLGVLLFAAVSCQKIGEVAPGEGNVSLTVSTPGVKTKTIADGSNVNVVFYEIYKADNGHKNSIKGGTPLIDGIIEDFGGTATLDLKLLQDQDYVALFWAQEKDQDCYDTRDLRNVTVDYFEASANDESRAAFCQVLGFSTSKSYSGKVELVRPFAQINLGTYKESLDIDYHIELEGSSMSVTGVATTFNVSTMKTGLDAINVDFTMDAVPDQMLEANDILYAYAGMNYILVPSDESNIDISYSIKTDVGTVSRKVLDVPAMKNHRTNLLGNLLTQETKIEIVVDDDFIKPDTDITLTTIAEQIAAAAPGETIWIPSKTKLVLPSNIADGVTIIGGEGTVFEGASKVSGNNITIKNVEFINKSDRALTGSLNNTTFVNCVFKGKEAVRYCYAYGNVVFEDCVFGDADCIRGVHFDAGNGSVTFNNCTLYGFQAFGTALSSVTFNDCSFPLNNNYNVVNMYSVFEYNNCTFNPQMHCDCADNNVTVAFNDCSYTDDSSIYGIVRFDKDQTTCTVTFDGVVYNNVASDPDEGSEQNN